jgi:RimJ/RimL family protein N-acetyltransferase
MSQLRAPEPSLSDGVVLLRPWQEADASALALVLNNPEAARWTSTPQPYRESDALAWFATHPDRWRRGLSGAFAITETERNRVVGSAELKVLDWTHCIGEVAYAVAPRDRGKGFATRAVHLMSSWALGEVGLERLELFAHPDNPASQRVALKAGYVREGVARSVRIMRGRRVDLVVFSLICSDLG